MKQLIVDYLPFEVKPEQITESMKENNGKLVVRGVLQRAEAKNQNGRVYPREVLVREAKKYHKEFIKQSRAMGELDHPESSVVNLQNVSHNIKEMHWEDKVTTGAASDIEQATKRARAMVMRAGLSKELGPVAYGENEEEVFLGRSVARQQNMSEETARKVDIEIRKIVDKGYERARKVLTEKIDDLHKLAKALLTYETLSGEEIENLINKNVYPADKQDLKVEDDKGSSLSAMGLKPKIVH